MVSLCHYLPVVYVGCSVCVVCGTLKLKHQNTALHDDIDCSWNALSRLKNE